MHKENDSSHGLKIFLIFLATSCIGGGVSALWLQVLQNHAERVISWTLRVSIIAFIVASLASFYDAGMAGKAIGFLNLFFALMIITFYTSVRRSIAFAASNLTAASRILRGFPGVITSAYMALLAHVVQLRVSRPTLRSALKAQLRDDVNPVMALLQLCNAWLSQIIQLPLSEVEAKSHATVAGQARVPDADAVMALANDVLDTFFPLLLVTPRSHATVQSLSRTISRYLQLMSTLRLLNAPLSAFAKLQQECELVARTEAADKSHKAGGTTLSASGAVASAGNAKVQPSSKADAAARAEMGGGLGIKLGTQGEAKTRRVHLLEQSMLVGAYSFERLEI